MEINLATTDQEIEGCFAVMHQLRPHLIEDEFLTRVRAQERDGYRLAYLVDGGLLMSVAGFRISQCLAWGRFLYVDDLVTVSSDRSKGYGAALLAWLEEFGRDHECEQIHLDSGMQRVGAHRFYKREKMETMGYHFSKKLEIG